MTPPDPRIGRLRWRSRRGMKELDKLLEPYFNGDLSACDEATLSALEHLLDGQDPELLDWLLGRAVPSDPQLGPLLDLIRKA